MSLRESDPAMAAFFDDMREHFGADEINANIRKGMQGVPGFFHYKGPAGEVGTRALPAPEGKEIDGRQMVLGSNAELMKKMNAGNERTAD